MWRSASGFRKTTTKGVHAHIQLQPGYLVDESEKGNMSRRIISRQESSIVTTKRESSLWWGQKHASPVISKVHRFSFLVVLSTTCLCHCNEHLVPPKNVLFFALGRSCATYQEPLPLAMSELSLAPSGHAHCKRPAPARPFSWQR